MSISPSATKTRASVTAVSWHRNWLSFAQTLVALFKLRIVLLLLLAATGGAFLGTGGRPGMSALLILVVAGGMAASGASALNQYLERESDGKMARTRRRPLPAGIIQRPKWVLVSGIILVLLPSLIVMPFIPALAFFLPLGAVIYVGVYTIWLKPRTLLNIVIGGAAGSAAVLSGGAAVGGWREPGVLVLALLLFLWTPSHFWSLAILYHKDYRRAAVPMLPARISLRAAAWWVFVHTGATGFAAVLLALVPGLGWIYLLPVGIAMAVL